MRYKKGAALLPVKTICNVMETEHKLERCRAVYDAALHAAARSNSYQACAAYTCSQKLADYQVTAGQALQAEILSPKQASRQTG